MDTKNNVVVVLLVVLIGILSGIGLLFGIGNAVGVATNPLNIKLSEIASSQKFIQDKLATGDLSSVNNRLTAIENRLTQMEGKLNGGGAPQNMPPQPPSEDYNKVYDIPIADSVIIGNKDAKATIVEFSDFQCPFCGRFYPVVKEVLNAYPNDVRLIVKNFPLSFHPNARPAAKLALAANEQGKYRETMELLLENGGDVSEAKVKEYAQKAGMNYDKLMVDYKNKDAQWEKKIVDDMKLAEAVDVRGTPTFYLNGKKTMARDLSTFKTEIDKILAGKG